MVTVVVVGSVLAVDGTMVVVVKFESAAVGPIGCFAPFSETTATSPCLTCCFEAPVVCITAVATGDKPECDAKCVLPTSGAQHAVAAIVAGCPVCV